MTLLRGQLERGTRVFNVLPIPRWGYLTGAYAISAQKKSYRKAKAEMLSQCRYTKAHFDESQLPKTRKEAAIAGSRFYKLDTPCVRGHSCRRYTATTRCFNCLEQDQEKRRTQRAGGRGDGTQTTSPEVTETTVK